MHQSIKTRRDAAMGQSEPSSKISQSRATRDLATGAVCLGLGHGKSQYVKSKKRHLFEHEKDGYLGFLFSSDEESDVNDIEFGVLEQKISLTKQKKPRLLDSSSSKLSYPSDFPVSGTQTRVTTDLASISSWVNPKTDIKEDMRSHSNDNPNRPLALGASPSEPPPRANGRAEDMMTLDFLYFSGLSDEDNEEFIRNPRPSSENHQATNFTKGQSKGHNMRPTTDYDAKDDDGAQEWDENPSRLIPQIVQQGFSLAESQRENELIENHQLLDGQEPSSDSECWFITSAKTLRAASRSQEESMSPTNGMCFQAIQASHTQNVHSIPSSTSYSFHDIRVISPDSHPSSVSNDPDALFRLPPHVSSISSSNKKLQFSEHEPGRHKWEMHPCRHDLDDQMPPDSSSWASCAVLSRLDGMFYCPKLGGILCPQHLGIIPLKQFQNHVRYRHTLALSDAGTPIESIIDHVSSVYRIPPNQSVLSLVGSIRTRRFEATIPNLPPPKRVIPCQLCDGWFVDSKTFKTHLKHSLRSPCLSILKNRWPGMSVTDIVHQAANAANESSSWGSRLLYGTGENSKYYVIYASGFEPESSTGDLQLDRPISIPDVTDIKPHWPWWIGASGANWEGYLEGILKTGTSWFVLRELVALPSRNEERSRELEGMFATELGKQVELGLEVLANKVAGRYLSDAYDRAHSFGPEFLNWFLQLANLNSPYVSSQDFAEYHQVLIQLVAIYARFQVAIESGRGERLGKFTPYISDSEIEPHQRIFNQLRLGKNANPGILAEGLHHLLIEVFTRRLDAEVPIASSLQQIFLLSTLSFEDGHFNDPEDTVPLFLMVQNCAMSTLIHIVDKGGLEAPFSFAEKELPLAESMKSPRGDGAEGVENEAGFPPFSEPASEDAFMRILDYYQEYIIPEITEDPTEMSRLYPLWKIFKKAIFGDGPGPGVKIYWARDNDHLFLSCGDIQPQKIVLNDLRGAILLEARAVEDSFHELTVKSNAGEFRLSMIEDDPDAASFLDRPANSAIFNKFIASFKAGSVPSLYNQKGELNGSRKSLRDKAEDFLQKCYHFLHTYVIPHIYHTCGVPLQAGQTGQLLFRSLNGHQRNLFISSRGMVYIASVPVKRLKKDKCSIFFPLTPSLGRILIYFLGVVRPVEVEIRRFFQANTLSHEHHIFVFPTLHPRRELHFDEDEVNTSLKSSSILPYEAQTQKHIFAAILDHVFPAHKHYIGSKQTPPAAQGRHSLHVKLDEYVLTRNLHIFADTDLSKFAISHTVHGWLGLVPRNYELNLYQMDYPGQPLVENAAIALDVAIDGVRQTYRLAAMPQSEVNDIATNAEQELDFLGYDNLTPDGKISFGTDLLIKVTAATCFGDRQPLHLLGPPIGGLDVDYVVEAAILILRALRALRAGVLRAPMASDKTSADIRAETGPSIQHLIRYVRDRQVSAWNVFGEQVYEASLDKRSA